MAFNGLTWISKKKIPHPVEEERFLARFQRQIPYSDKEEIPYPGFPKRLLIRIKKKFLIQYPGFPNKFLILDFQRNSIFGRSEFS